MDNLQSMKILIVDDDTISRKLLKGILKKAGYTRLMSTGKGQEAVNLIKKETPDLVCLDIFMPGVRGYDICRDIRSDKTISHIPVLMVTGGAAPADETLEESFKAGATDFVTKPIRAIEFLVRVKAALTLKYNHDLLMGELEKRKKAEKEKEDLINDLKNALSKVKQLGGLIPICSYCKKVRDDKGYWKQVEEYICKHSEADFSHGICPECMVINFPEIAALE